ncbi:hypothetical protein Btru_044068 [Bulinus truncatus]|nr:hypothetical protein Btru_044068 [Bulinus truncatus]
MNKLVFLAVMLAVFAFCAIAPTLADFDSFEEDRWCFLNCAQRNNCTNNPDCGSRKPKKGENHCNICIPLLAITAKVEGEVTGPHKHFGKMSHALIAGRLVILLALNLLCAFCMAQPELDQDSDLSYFLCFFMQGSQGCSRTVTD